LFAFPGISEAMNVDVKSEGFSSTAPHSQSLTLVQVGIYVNHMRDLLCMSKKVLAMACVARHGTHRPSTRLRHSAQQDSSGRSIVDALDSVLCTLSFYASQAKVGQKLKTLLK
jgi:hypothetical protein